LGQLLKRDDEVVQCARKAHALQASRHANFTQAFELFTSQPFQDKCVQIKARNVKADNMIPKQEVSGHDFLSFEARIHVCKMCASVVYMCVARDLLYDDDVAVQSVSLPFLSNPPLYPFAATTTATATEVSSIHRPTP
jgi:hypothetical protein